MKKSPMSIEQIKAILDDTKIMSRKEVCAKYGIGSVALHRLIHRPAHLLGVNAYEAHRAELRPMVDELTVQGHGIEAIVEIIKSRGFTCSYETIRSIRREF